MSSIRETIIDNLLVAANALITDKVSYPNGIREISQYNENKLTTATFESPMVMVLDTGEERKLVEDSTNIRWSFDVLFGAIVKGGSNEIVISHLNGALADIKKFITSTGIKTSLGSAVLDVQYATTEQARYYKDGLAGDVIARARIIYYTAIGTY